MLIEAILAFAALNELHETAPQQLKPFDTLQSCLIEADKRNRTEEGLRDPEVRARGGEFVCLTIKRAGGA